MGLVFFIIFYFNLFYFFKKIQIDQPIYQKLVSSLSAGFSIHDSYAELGTGRGKLVSLRGMGAGLSQFFCMERESEQYLTHFRMEISRDFNIPCSLY
jgi:hypothetical protein